MNRPLVTFFLCFFAMALRGQDERLPADLRQHNLTTYNASLFNPAFSLGRNNPESVALWVRWQWQGIDADPSTLFLNYTRKLGDRSAGGAAFFQHNTGIFFNTGGAINYAYKFEFNPRVKLAVGANLFGFKQTLADDRFQVDPDLPLPLPTETEDFILQMAPGISLEVERLTLSLASENLLDYNFRAKEANTSQADKTFMSLLSYDFPMAMGSATNAFLRPSMYLRTLPGQANQVGFYALLNTNRYWTQVGYNNFYGYALSAGVTFFKRFSVGALAEFGTGASMVKEPSFELMASYFLGTPDERHKMVGHDLEEDGIEAIAAEKLQKQLEQEAEKEREAKELEAQEREAKEQEAQEQEAQEQEGKAREAKKREAVAEAEKMERQRERDSIVKARQAEILKAEQQRRIDSVAQAKAAARKVEEAQKAEAAKARKEAENQPEVESKPQTGEKYEEVATEAGMLPGYYLIANVFGTQEYFNAFIADIKRKGIQPKSFRRSTNGYNYVYLQRYRTLREAREARDSQYGGKYTGTTWIFRVVGE